ncbi:MAG: pyridoxal phosphate-dependent aminotransferase [Desulfurococcales archaeon]|nr:pyridoxal phosphate-dependent aminotransferase [Desulfurococcales archaeon]
MESPTLSLNPSMLEIMGETGFSYLEIARRLRSEGRRIISFGIGQPDFVTPRHVREAAKRALDEGFTGYTETRGIPELREAIAWYLNSRFGADVDADEVIVTPGAKTAIYMAILAYTRPGDEVIIPEPSYYAYSQVVKLSGGRPVFVPMRFEPGEGFTLDVGDVEEAVTEKTRMIVINNPHNPTGTVLGSDVIEPLVELARKRGIIVVSDEIYDNFVYEGRGFKSVISYPDWRDNIVYINGFSKTFSMTGWRLGYLVVRREVVPRFVDLGVTLYSCPPSIAQKAGVEALKGDWSPVEEMIREFEERGRLLYTILGEAGDLIEAYKPGGAFYMFPRVANVLRRAGLKVEEFVRKLLYDHGVLVLPGSSFPDTLGSVHVRLSFATSKDDIEEGARRIIEASKKIVK